MIVVAGAGPAGLAAALAAARAGHAVTVVEAADHVGGMAASFTVGGVRVDHGSHRLHPAMSTAVSDLLRPLLGDDLQLRTRNGRVLVAGEWLSFPLRTGELLGRLPRATATRMAIDALVAPLRSERADTFAEFVRARLGPTVLREFYGPYARKLWGRDATRLSGEIARRRIAVSSPVAMARKLLRARAPGGRSFYATRGGIGTISERLADAAAEAGADIRTSSPLRSVRVLAGGVEVDTGNQTIGASALLSSVPLPVLLGALDGLGNPVATHEYRGLVLVYLVVDAPSWTPFDAHYLPGLDVIASRISEPKNYRDDPADPSDTTVLCAEVPVSPGDEWWDASPDELAARLLDDIGRVGLPEPNVIETVVRRVDRVYPVFGPGDDPLAGAEAIVDRHPGVITFGRGGRVNVDNTHHVIDMGLAAAATLDHAGRVDHEAWARRRQVFANHVVED